MSEQEYEATEPEVVEAEAVETDGGSDDQAAEIEARAREWGWRPKDEWRGNPDGWRSAEDFVRRGEEVLPFVQQRAEKYEREAKELRDRLDRLGGIMDKSLRRQADQHKAELAAIEARQRQAVENGDVEAYDALRKREAMLRESAPETPPEPQQQAQQQEMPQETQEFLTRNSWLQADPVAQRAAFAAAEQARLMGVGISGQITAAEQELRQLRPQHFKAAQPATPPSAEGGGSRPVKRGKGAADLPRDAKEAWEKVKNWGVYKDVHEYAREYWAQER